MQQRNNIKNLIDLRVWLVLVFSVTSFNFASATDFSFSIYGGFNKAGHSSVSFAGAFEDYGINNGKYSVEGWEGKSFESPIYYGYRMGFPLSNKPALKIAIDFNHSKVKAKRLPGNLKRLEFTDGLNTLTLNLLYTFENFFDFKANVSPYVGAGFGLAYPHVDVEGVPGKNGKTYDYQHTGFAYQLMVGMEHKLANSWKTFAEYRITYTPIDADLTGGGSIKTDILNNQVSVGLGYIF